MCEPLARGNRQLEAFARVRLHCPRFVMNEQGSPPPERLDSWKAIAAYLGRDVATVRRWERLHRLPIRRIAGRGRSVFAYGSEIDEWLRAMPPADLTPAAGPPIEVAATALSARPFRRWPWAAALVLAAAGLFWSIPLLTSEGLPFRVEMTPTGIVAADQAGREQWRYGVPVEDQRLIPPPLSEIRILGGTAPGVLAATAFREHVGDGTVRGGQLLWLSPRGQLARTFSFDDAVSFGDVRYDDPWMIDDFSVEERSGLRRIAVAAHHEVWFPSLVTVLNEQWQRVGTFVNAGFVNQVNWLSPDRLLIVGYSNAHNGAMVGLLDPDALDGQSPPGADPMYQCGQCASGRPLRYIVMPRSEVNQASGAKLNGATVYLTDGRILVRTIEVPRTADAVEALYEFSPALDLVRASYGDRYWEAHRALEVEGRINHTRDRCPDRDGPRGLTAWEKTSGWQPLHSK